MSTITDSRRHDFFMVDNAVIDHLGSVLGPYAGWVYVTILRHANWQTNVAFPGISRLVKLTGISRNKVIDCIAELERLGLIAVKRSRSETGKNHVNQYTVLPVKSEGVVHTVDQGSAHGALGVVHTVNPNDTKENDTKELFTADAVTAVPEKPKPARKRDPLFDAIQETFQTGNGQTATLKAVMSGTSKKFRDCNFETAATAAEVEAFGTWYRRMQPDTSVPTAPEKVETWFKRFRQDGGKPPAPAQLITPPGVSADVAAAMALTRRELCQITGVSQT